MNPALRHALGIMLLVWSLPALTTESDTGPTQAKSLDELLQLVKSARLRESKEHRQREAAFKAENAQRKQLLNKALATKAAAEAEGQVLEQTLIAGEQQVEALDQRLQEQLGSLKELFGHISATATDTAQRFEHSLVSAQLPERRATIDGLLAQLNTEQRLPAIEDIRGLVFELSRELVEAGRVRAFQAEVLQRDGSRVNKEVVRVGLYNLLADGQYLDQSSDGVLIELPGLPRHLVDDALALQSGSDTFTKIAIDPTGPNGGNLLRALATRPGWDEKWRQGGLVGYAITALGAVALLLALWRVVVLRRLLLRVLRQQRNISEPGDNPLGRVLEAAGDAPGQDPEALELRLYEAVLKERPAIEYGLTLLKIIAMIAPLMGLLGTVSGMIWVFQQITLFGAGDPKLMAGGISQALVTTVLGLVVAIPTLLLHTWINGKARAIIQILDEQSAGLVAMQAESGHAS